MTEGSGYGPYPYSGSPAAGTAGYGGGGYGYGGFPPPPPPRRRGGAFLSHLAVAVLALGVGVGATVAIYQPTSSSTSASGSSGNSALPGGGSIPGPGASTVPNGQSGSTNPAAEQAVINKVEPGVVLINSNLQYNSEAGAGTGMVINSDGLVLTNNHVIEDSTGLTVTVPSTDKTYKATVIGYDKTGDVALIKLENASGLHTVPLGNSSAMKSGDQVVALGNAEGQGGLIPATGSIIATNQTIQASDDGGSITSETLHGMLKTDADIVSGDSGGPLSNTSGQVIGMDTAGDNAQAGSGQSATGFAIPINTALSIAREIASGKASSTISIGYPAFVGIFIADTGTSAGQSSSPQVQAQDQDQSSGGSSNPFGGGEFGGGGGAGGQQGGGDQEACVQSNASVTIPSQIANVSSGTLVDNVICSSPASAAGMTAGSVITSVNGQAAGSPDHLGGILAALKPGDSVSLSWTSPSGHQTTSTLHLAAGPPQ
ncbi:MAG TPA: trypsin-like peptidase domain-containing protein [Trebonia sp.]|jgi:S1-C subfamily serine protease|nr:trypsin-like peptidase domain-containing protein [Trebonia sp.]